MKRKSNQVDLVKMLFYILAHLWLVVLFAELGFASRYLHVTRRLPETYTSSGTMYVNNKNPNSNDYQYTSAYDLNAAVQLIKTYLVVVRSDKVMSAVTEKLAEDHPGITPGAVSASVTMESVSETGVVAVKSTTTDPKLSTDIVNVVMEIAPEEIIRVVGAGNVEILDYATVPILPNPRNAVYIGLRNGATIGAAIAVVILAVLYLLNQKITSAQDLKENYDLPILASIKRIDVSNAQADSFMLNNQSPMEIVENYAKLRMNLFYTLVGKGKTAVVITSSISGEGKSTIASNLAISCAMSGKKVLLVDGDMRRASQMDIFKSVQQSRGLSDALVGQCHWQEAIIPGVRDNVDLLPAGQIPPNPSELLDSIEMERLIQELEQAYDLVLLDMPPINIVSDPLVISSSVAGCLFVTRQNFTDRRDVRKALSAAEMTGMNILGFVFYGEHLHEGSYYSRRYYKSYYNKYDYRRRTEKTLELSAVESTEKILQEENTAASLSSNVVESTLASGTSVKRGSVLKVAEKEMSSPPVSESKLVSSLDTAVSTSNVLTHSAATSSAASGVSTIVSQAKSDKALSYDADAVNQSKVVLTENGGSYVIASPISVSSHSLDHTIQGGYPGSNADKETVGQNKVSEQSFNTLRNNRAIVNNANKEKNSSSIHGKDVSETAKSALQNMRHSLQNFMTTRTKKTDVKKDNTKQ